MTLGFTRTTHSFFTMLWRTIDQVRLGWNGFPTRGKKQCGQTDRKRQKVIQTRGNRVGRQGWVIGFLIKIWGPTLPHLERVCCGHNINWCGFSIKKFEDTKQVQNMHHSLYQNRYTSQQLKDIHCKCVCFKKGCLRFVEQTSNNNLVFWRQRREDIKVKGVRLHYGGAALARAQRSAQLELTDPTQ